MFFNTEGMTRNFSNSQNLYKETYIGGGTSTTMSLRVVCSWLMFGEVTSPNTCTSEAYCCKLTFTGSCSVSKSCGRPAAYTKKNVAGEEVYKKGRNMKENEGIMYKYEGIMKKYKNNLRIIMK